MSKQDMPETPKAFIACGYELYINCLADIKCKRRILWKKKEK